VLLKKAWGRDLLLRFGCEQEWEAHSATSVCCSGCLSLGDVSGVNGNDTDATLMRGDHDTLRLAGIHTKLCLQHDDNELPRGKVIVDENNFVKPGSLGFWLNLGARPAIDISHRKKTPGDVTRIEGGSG
jgi:hypothetical protein